MKRNLKILIALTTLILVTGASLGFAMEPDGNKRKGKYTYRNVYKACNQRGEVDSKTPFISPADKTMAQWKRIFDKKNFEMFKCSPEFNALSETDLKDIYTYLYNHGYDSPQPATCQ